jgi:hypothetical protein
MAGKSTRTPLALLFLCAAVGLSACGGGGSSSAASADVNTANASANPNISGGAVVARVGSTPITQAAVSHWMKTLAGGDYYELSSGNTLPDGLVSEPPNYAKCVAGLEAAAAASPSKKEKPTGVVLLNKCRRLYQGLRAQAIGFLVKALWLPAAYREEGITASEAEVLAFFKRYRSENFPTESQLHEYLSKRRLSLSDLLTVLKLDLLGQKSQKAQEAGGQQVYAKLIEAEQRWTEKVDCSPGYVTEHCRQFKGGEIYGSGPPASVLIEQVAALATGRCINLEACAKQ